MWLLCCAGSRAVEHAGWSLVKSRYLEWYPWKDLETAMSFEVSRQAALRARSSCSAAVQLSLYRRCCHSSDSYIMSCQGTQGRWQCSVCLAVPCRGTKNEFWVEGKVEVMPADIRFKAFTKGCGRWLLEVFSWLSLYRIFFFFPTSSCHENIGLGCSQFFC